MLIKCGGIQFNHCRLTLAAAVKEKMKCILVLEEGLITSSEPDFNGNYFLYHLLGTEKVEAVPNGTYLMKEMQKVAEDVMEEGHGASALYARTALLQ
jgi:D-cysteine desulfhydrase